MRRGCALAAAIGTIVLGPASAHATVNVLFCQVTGNPKALVPAGAGLAPGTEFKVQATNGFDRPFASPDGTKFFFTGLANLPITEDECYIVVNGVSAATVVREGTTTGSPTGDILGTGDQRMGINNAGQFVFGIRNGAVTTQDKCIIRWDGTAFTFAAREGTGVPGAPTENWSDNLNSGHILADGTPAFCGTDTAGTLPGSQDDFCMRGSTIVIQTGNAIGSSTWATFNLSNFWITPDGAHVMAIGDDATAAASNRILAVDGVVQAREGVPLIGSSYTANVSANFGGNESLLCNDGSYLLRGHNVDGVDWVLRNGVVIADTGDPITTGSAEHFSDATVTDCFFTIAGNAVGDYLIGGFTDAADVNTNAVLVLNGTQVVARKGDMIDLNGNGLPDDDAFISAFNSDDCFLTDSRRLVFFADARNGAGTSIGQMVLDIEITPPPPPCVADIDGSGTVDVNDLLAVITSWGACPRPCPPSCPADIAPEGGDCAVNVNDLLAVITSWGPCP